MRYRCRLLNFYERIIDTDFCMPVYAIRTDCFTLVINRPAYNTIPMTQRVITFQFF